MTANEDAGRNDVERAIEATLERFDARRREEEHAQKAKTQRKEALTNRVSIAAIGLTMLMSFLGFARSERSGAAGGASSQAERAQADADSAWAYFQTRSSERASYRLSDDQLARTAAALPETDPRVLEAEVLHADYAAHVASINRDNRQVFFHIADLERQRVLLRRESASIGKKVDRYDLASRVLTLAVVLLSVTLLANREALFWMALAIASIGAAIAVDGYLLVV